MAAEQKKALLLHSAGPDIQDIFETLPPLAEAALLPLAEADIDENDDAYQIAVKTLDRYFLPHSNVPYERQIFRQLEQEEHKTVDQFIS